MWGPTGGHLSFFINHFTHREAICRTWAPLRDRSSTLLRDCGPKGGAERQGRYPGLEEEEGQQLELQTPGEVQTRPHERRLPETRETPAQGSAPGNTWCSLLCKAHTMAQYRHSSLNSGASCLGSNPGSVP